MYKHILFAMPHGLWISYHNFGVYSWYNAGFCKWAHSQIPYCSRCQYYGKLSTDITNLTPALIQSHKLAVTFQQITRHKTSSILYFKKKILYFNKEDHTTCDEHTLPDPRPHWTWCTRKFIFVMISQVPKSPSRTIVTDPFPRSFTTINNYFYVLCRY